MIALVSFLLIVAAFGICDCSRHSEHPTPKSDMCKDERLFAIHPPAFVYLITSHEPVFIADILPDNSTALLAFSDPLPDGTHCPCCIWSILGQTQKSFLRVANQSSLSIFPLAPPSDFRRRIRWFMRTRLWLSAQSLHSPMETGFFRPEYVVLLDLAAFTYSFENIRENLIMFHRLLTQQQPNAAVPFHPCNIVDPAESDDAIITSVYETHLVAVHRSASKLLLLLDEELFSLVCYLMLRGTVMQFQFGDRASGDSSACQLADATNQNVMMHLVSSLLAEEFIFALPFTPRIQSPRRPPYFMLSSNGEYSVALDGALDGNNCPVMCSFYYWAAHPAFACCSSANVGQVQSPAYNADTAYAIIAQRWKLPRSHDLACEGLASENYVKHATTTIRKGLTHPLPKFGLALSAPPITLDDQCSCKLDSPLPRAPAGALSRFKLTLQPNQLQLQTTGHESTAALRVHLQIVLSAPGNHHVDSDAGRFAAVFGSVESMLVRTQCQGSETVVIVDVRQLKILSETDHPHQSALAPWFFLPSEHIEHRQWFEVTSNVSSDALRVLIADVSVSTPCNDFMFVSANASVLLREMATAGHPCSCSSVSAESHNVSFSAQEVARRASVLAEDAPDDLFDDGDEAGPEGMHSDFACAGPNRGWMWGEQPSTALPKEASAGHYNMCLFRNICWIDGALTLFLPKSFAFLDSAIPSFFEFENESLLTLNLCPYSMDDSRRTRWYPELVFDDFPSNVRFAKNVTHFLALSKGNPKKFGHDVYENMASIYHAMESFDICLLAVDKCIFNTCYGPISTRSIGTHRVLDHSTCFLTLQRSWTNTRLVLAFVGWLLVILLSHLCRLSTFRATALRTFCVSGDSICNS